MAKRKIVDRVDWALVALRRDMGAARARGVALLALGLRRIWPALEHTHFPRWLRVPPIPALKLGRHAPMVRFIFLFVLLGWINDLFTPDSAARGGNVLFDALIIGFGAWCAGLVIDAFRASFKP